MFTSRTIVRRAALALSLALVATVGIATVRIGALQATPVTTTTKSIAPSNRWLDGLKASHKQFFDAPAANGGVALVHVLNYYETYNKAFNVKDADINAVLTFYAGTTFYALDDAAWARYRLGEFLEANDPVTGKPATSNPWRTAPVILGLTLPQASIESLKTRGATLIVCNNAMQIFAGLLAAKRGMDPKVVYEDLKASIIPGINLVPGMVVAVEQAQRAGLTYHRQ